MTSSISNVCHRWTLVIQGALRPENSTVVLGEIKGRQVAIGDNNARHKRRCIIALILMTQPDTNIALYLNYQKQCFFNAVLFYSRRPLRKDSKGILRTHSYCNAASLETWQLATVTANYLLAKLKWLNICHQKKRREWSLKNILMK